MEKETAFPKAVGKLHATASGKCRDIAEAEQFQTAPLAPHIHYGKDLNNDTMDRARALLRRTCPNLAYISPVTVHSKVGKKSLTSGTITVNLGFNA